MSARSFFSTLLLVLGLCAYARAATTSANVVFGAFTDPACTQYGFPGNVLPAVPVAATNGTCSPLASLFFSITTLGNGTITGNMFCTDNNCASCLLTASFAPAVCTAVPVPTIGITVYIIAYNLQIDTQSLTSYGSIISTNSSYSLTSTCSAASTAHSVNLGTCTGSSATGYGLISRIGGDAQGYGFVSLANCSSSTCTTCSSGGFYSANTQCFSSWSSLVSGSSSTTGSSVNLGFANGGSTATSTGAVSGGVTGNNTASGTSSTGSTSNKATSTSSRATGSGSSSTSTSSASETVVISAGVLAAGVLAMLF